jgi:GTP pyrophosphokinase
MTIEQLTTAVKKNNPKDDLEMLRLAYDFASNAHKNQKRKTGEPYIQHSLQTAFILAQMKTDVNTVIAGLLHDVPEDTDCPIEEIKKNFGEEVAGLVEGVTKLSKIKYRGVERYAESLRKMLLAMSEDLRVIIIKFADRFHNLRTLDPLPPEKQERIARETLEIYAPIADLLGAWRLKWQMEDLCFKYLYPEEYKKIEYKYEVEKKVERNQYFQTVKNILSKELKKEGVEHEINSRFKHLYSIFKKMQAKERKFDEIYDVFAMRVIVNTIPDCYKALGIIHNLWKPKPERFKDYIALPKPNGYRSIHTTVFGPDGKATEFQIRTKEMDDQAHYGVAAHWYYKQNLAFSKSKQPRWIKEILDIQANIKDTDKFIKQVKLDVFRDRIFVFTPKGDVYDLPEGATSVDFAYAVHTDVGNRCAGAMINNKMSNLDTQLKSGDMVEIVTDKNRKGPNRDWLKFVKTQKARNKIKQYSKASRLEAIRKLIPGM